MDFTNSTYAHGSQIGQTHALHASNGTALPSHCSDKTSSEKMKMKPGKAMAMALLGLLLFLPHYGMSQAITQITANPLTSNMVVEKTVQSSSIFDTYLVLCHGTDHSPSNNALNVTMVYECTASGGVIWCYKYGFPAATGHNSTFTGYAIAVDNGGLATGKIGIGGYASDGSSGSTNDFVMELDTDGTVSWLQTWNFSTMASGVTDLLFNHEVGPNAGSITAVSIDVYSGNPNLYVTLIHSTGILGSIVFSDAANYLNFNPSSTVDLKPRIVESPSAMYYYIIGTRLGSNVGIAFWSVGYGLLPITAGYSLYKESGFNVGATGAVEDEGTYTPSGSPTVFISGYESATTPLFLEVAPGSPATFTPLTVPPLSPPFSSETYLFPTDLTIVGYDANIGGPALMASANFQGSFSSGSSAPYVILLYEVPMTFTSTPPPTCYINTMQQTDTAVYGGICSTGSTYTSPYISAAATGTVGNIMYVNADDGPNVCANPVSISSFQPTFSPSSTASGTSKSPVAVTVTPYATSLPQILTPNCVYTPPAPEPAGSKGTQPAPSPGSEENMSGVNIQGGTGQVSVHSYPNPVTGTAYIDITGQISTAATVTVFDMAGKALSSGNASIVPGTSHISVDMGSLSVGMYIVQITNTAKSVDISVRIEKQ